MAAKASNKFKRPWYHKLPSCAPGDCYDANSFEEAVHLCLIELDLIDEGQEASTAYTPAEVRELRRFCERNISG